MKKLLIALFFFVVLTSCSSMECNDNSTDCTRVFFIGNSYTYVNDLPSTFAKLAQSGNHRVEVAMLANGGAVLADYVNSAEMQNILDSKKWDFVVLQEQSQIPAVQESRIASMYPAARSLVKLIRQTGAKPILFETWGHQNGYPEKGMNYEAMQYHIDEGYLAIARELNVTVSPVGLAWFRTLQKNPRLELWQADGSHPSTAGTYLAACVFYAVIFRENPSGLTYYGGLSKELAGELQNAAQDVLDHP